MVRLALFFSPSTMVQKEKQLDAQRQYVVIGTLALLFV